MAKQVLDRIGSDIREVTRLLTDSSSNEDVCLRKLESSIVHFDSISNMLDPAMSSHVKQSLCSLRDELQTATAVNTDRTSFRAERPLTGK